MTTFAFRYLFFPGLAAAMMGGGVLADAINDPFVSSNRNPFVQIYGLPAASTATLLQPGTSSLGLQLEAANNFTENNSAGEQVFIDGESHRANVQWRYGVGTGFEVGVDIPYISQDSGGLDSFIEDWHDLFGLPDGGRPNYPRNQLRFSYQNDRGDSYLVSEPDAGLGDISLSMGYQLFSGDNRQWAVRAALKLPTGDADSLLGSESTDLSLSLNVSDQGWLQHHSVSVHGSVGILLMEGGEVLEHLRKDTVLLGSATLSWAATDNVSLKLQLDAHSAFYDSALTELGSDSAQLLIGGTVRLNEQWMVDLAVSEDIAVDTAPDVVFHLGMKRLFVE